MRNGLKLILFCIWFVSLVFPGNNSPKKEDVTITLSGEVGSENSTWIKAPWYWHRSYKITYLPPEGIKVEKGDTVTIFDTKEVEENLDKMQQELEQLQKNFKSTVLSNQQALQEIENSITTQKIEQQIVMNQVAQSKYNSQAEQQDKKLELKKVELNILSTKQSLESQKILNKNSENEALIKIEQKKSSIQEYEKLNDQLYLTTPRSGIVIYHRTGWRGDGPKVRIGEEVRPTSSILSIPELDNIIVNIDLNEVDLSKVQIGQPAEISILAYPDTVFHGTINFISRIANRNEDSNLRIYPVTIKLDSKRNFRLKPGLTAKVDLVISSGNDRFSIPSWCLFKDEDGFYVKESQKNSREYPEHL